MAKINIAARPVRGRRLWRQEGPPLHDISPYREGISSVLRKDIWSCSGIKSGPGKDEEGDRMVDERMRKGSGQWSRVLFHACRWAAAPLSYPLFSRNLFQAEKF